MDIVIRIVGGIRMTDVDIYEKLKAVLRDEGWKEQTCGDVYINGEYATNFGKDGEMVHISWTDWADEEEWESCFEEYE